jgi:ribonuclease HII
MIRTRAAAKDAQKDARKNDAKAERAGTTSRPSFRRERAILKQGLQLVAGCDEAGRGPLAGPWSQPRSFLIQTVFHEA